MSRLDVPGYFTSITGLGRLLEYYPLKNQRRNRIGSVILAVVSLAAALLILVVGVLAAYERYYENGPAILWKSISIPAAGAAILAAVGLVSLIGSLRTWNKGAAVFEKGLASSDMRGVTAWRWQDIESIQMDMISRRMGRRIGSIQHTYTLKNRQNQHMVLDESLGRVEQLGLTIRERVTPLILERLTAAFEQGRAVQAGPLSLSRSGGLQYGKRAIAWQAVKEVSVEHGVLRICLNPQLEGKEDPVAAVPAAQVPNLEVIYTLIQAGMRGNL